MVKMLMVMFYAFFFNVVAISYGLASNVYVLSGGDTVDDQAIIQALTNEGFTATLGTTPALWDGSQVDLENFEVVILNSNAWVSSVPNMPDSGQLALLSFIEEGGGMVTNAWTGWRLQSRGDYLQLEPAFPFTYSSYSSYSETRYSKVTENSLIHCGVPNGFQFDLGSISGSEENYVLKPGATEFYGSVHSDQSVTKGLIGKAYGQGRVASFSTVLTATDLSNENMAKLFTNAVTWSRSLLDESAFCADEMCFPVKTKSEKKALICL